MLLWCIFIAFFGFGVEQESMATSHFDYIVHIEKAAGTVFLCVRNSVMLFPFVSVFVPPFYVPAILFKEFFKRNFRRNTKISFRLCGIEILLRTMQ